MNRVCIYTRVSTGGQTLEPQIMELENYCAARGWTIVARFSDIISGTKSSRKGLDEMMAAVRRHAFDAVMVVKLDRVARSLGHFAQVVAEFQKHGVGLVIPAQGIDTSNASPASTLQRNILAAFAEFERELIVERTKAGLAAAKARGVRLGHPSTRLPKDWEAILRAWQAEGGTHIRDLALRLGGISVSFAHKLATDAKKSAA